ncbi:MAG: hypothetical protein M3126_09055 [Candidatus Eremiobacteraeota bacterium]|nr:hypothetical protein [Candidatus Eremiobacteraeota bacterium]
MKRSLYAGAIAFAVILITSHLRSTPYNNYVLLADAFLHHHVWIDWPGPSIDALALGGHRYVIEAPLPALLMMPAVLFFGTDANQTLLAVVLGAVAVGAAWEICERLAVPFETTVWLCAFLLAGTDLLWCAMLGDVWFIAHVSAVCFSLLALCELLGAKRGWLVALWAVCAAESRFTMALAIPVYAFMLTRSVVDEDAPPQPLQIRTALLWFAGVILISGLLWVRYNQARWGTLADIGYSSWYHQDQVGEREGSPFRLMYFPQQLYSFFVAPPEFSSTFPYVTPSQLGTAVTWTSPAFVLAAFARLPRMLVWTMVAAAVLTAGPNLLYYVNGFAQFGMRHALDFAPFLFVLMALAVRERFTVWARAFIGYSVAAGLWGCWYWNVFLRAQY